MEKAFAPRFSLSRSAAGKGVRNVATTLTPGFAETFRLLKIRPMNPD